MSKTYQKNRRAGQAAIPEVAVPERVVVSMAEIAESAKEGFEEDVTACAARRATEIARTGSEGVGHLGRAPHPGDPPPGPGRGRLRGAAPAVV